MLYKRGFTLFEVLIVVVIASILAGLSIAYYTNAKEATLDKQVKADLKLLQAAEKNYRMDVGNYYPSSSSTGDLNNINSNLKVNLPTSSSRAWDFRAWSTGCIRATRNGGDNRTWRIRISEDEPVSNASCP